MILDCLFCLLYIYKSAVIDQSLQEYNTVKCRLCCFLASPLEKLVVREVSPCHRQWFPHRCRNKYILLEFSLPDPSFLLQILSKLLSNIHVTEFVYLTELENNSVDCQIFRAVCGLQHHLKAHLDWWRILKVKCFYSFFSRELSGIHELNLLGHPSHLTYTSFELPRFLFFNTFSTLYKISPDFTTFWSSDS